MEKNKYILACINGVPPSDSVCDYAAWIAHKSKKELKLFHTLDHHNLAKETDLSGSIGLGAKDDLLNELVAIEFEQNKLLQKKAKLILKAAKTRVEKLGISDPNLCLRNGRLINNILDFKSSIAVTIIGRFGVRHQDDKSQGAIGHKVEAVIRSFEKPVLVVSRPFIEPKSVLFAFDGSDAAQKALDFIIKGDLFKKVSLHLVYVGDKTEQLMEALEVATQTLKKAKFEVQNIHLEGDVGKCILNYLEDKELDMIVMGAFGHNWIHDLIMGSLTSKILSNNDKPTLLIR